MCQCQPQHSITNQKSRYLEQNNKIDSKNIIKITDLKYKVPSEALEDKLYNVDMEKGICECRVGLNKGPCKHKKAVAIK